MDIEKFLEKFNKLQSPTRKELEENYKELQQEYSSDNLVFEDCSKLTTKKLVYKIWDTIFIVKNNTTLEKEKYENFLLFIDKTISDIKENINKGELKDITEENINKRELKDITEKNMIDFKLDLANTMTKTVNQDTVKKLCDTIDYLVNFIKTNKDNKEIVQFYKYCVINLTMDIIPTTIMKLTELNKEQNKENINKLHNHEKLLNDICTELKEITKKQRSTVETDEDLTESYSQSSDSDDVSEEYSESLIMSSKDDKMDVLDLLMLMADKPELEASIARNPVLLERLITVFTDFYYSIPVKNREKNNNLNSAIDELNRLTKINKNSLESSNAAGH